MIAHSQKRGRLASLVLSVLALGVAVAIVAYVAAFLAFSRLERVTDGPRGNQVSGSFPIGLALRFSSRSRSLKPSSMATATPATTSIESARLTRLARVGDPIARSRAESQYNCQLREALD
jgi:hypothetical protein